MAASSSSATLSITVEFGGGTEFLTSTKKVKKHVLKVPAQVPDYDPSQATAAAIADDNNIPVAAPISSAATSAADAVATNGDTDKYHSATMRDLVQFVLKALITERHSMLVEPDGSIRPGILILINEADWELEGEMEYELQDGDHVCFISTLHGG